LGARADTLLVNNVQLHEFAISCVVQDLTSKFTWKFVVVYGSPYEDKKDLSKLAGAMAYWGGGGGGF
jgi:hypothetical protein